MSRTIVQEYGPIYGEAVNGTVMGRPNGSIYIPSSNTIQIDLPEDYQYYYYILPDTLHPCDSSGITNIDGCVNVVANAQDLASIIQVQLYSDSALTTLVAHRDLAAGLFNTKVYSLFEATAGLTDGQTLYLRAQMMNGGVPIATSNTITVTMVVAS